MAPRKILVGSYNDSIYTLAFDPAPGAATLQLISQARVGDRPSWIEAHPSDRTLIFATLEQTDGQIVVLKYGADGTGHKIDEATCPSGGADPCALLATADELVIGNYSSGTLATLPISTAQPYMHPAQLWTLTLPFEHDKPGRDLSRQTAAHSHQIVLNAINPAEQELLVPDLGSDTVWRLTKDPRDGCWAVRGYVNVPTGGGPRHVVTYGNTLYVLLELTSELCAYKFHPRGCGESEPQFTHLTTLSTLTASPTPRGMNAAEILIPRPNPSFPTAYIYTSNREDPHPEGDTIAIYSLEKGEEHPELVTEVRTGLRHLRGMAFGGENDEWLIVGGAGSGGKNVGGGIKIYERVERGRGLRQVAALDEAVGGTLKPTAFLWL